MKPGPQDKYDTIELLGAGGFAEVYKAVRKEDGLTVALKVPRLAGFQTTQPEAFLKEADHWKNLRHPGIVRLIEFGQTPIPYIAMEYMPGGSLRSRIGSLTLPEALAIAGQLAEALFYAHRHGLVHLDIKPENVLFDGAGNARLSDFGLSRVMLSSLSGAAPSLSAAFYSAPEQFVPGREYGIRDWQTDIWQFGATLYEMVTGQLPFPAQDMMELMHKILHEEPAPLSQAKPGLRVSPETERLITQCLKKYKKDRFDDFHPIRNHIRSILPTSEPQAGPGMGQTPRRLDAGAVEPRPAASSATPMSAGRTTKPATPSADYPMMSARVEGSEARPEMVAPGTRAGREAIPERARQARGPSKFTLLGVLALAVVALVVYLVQPKPGREAAPQQAIIGSVTVQARTTPRPVTATPLPVTLASATPRPTSSPAVPGSSSPTVVLPSPRPTERATVSPPPVSLPRETSPPLPGFPGAPPTAAPSPLSVEQITARVAPFVVSVKGTGGVRATGLIFSDTGYVLTDYRTVRGLKEVEMLEPPQATSVAQLHSYDPAQGLALLKMRSTRRNTPGIAGASKALPGERALVMGYSPAGKPLVVTISFVGGDPFDRKGGSRIIGFSPAVPTEYLGAPLVSLEGAIMGMVAGQALTPLGTPILKGLNVALDPTMPADRMPALQRGEPASRLSPDLTLVPYSWDGVVGRYAWQRPNAWSERKATDRVVFTLGAAAFFAIREDLAQNIGAAMDDFNRGWSLKIPDDYKQSGQTQVKDASGAFNGQQIEWMGWRGGSGSYVKAIFYVVRYGTSTAIEAATGFEWYYEMAPVFERMFESFRVEAKP